MNPSKNYFNILIFNPAFLGDTVLTTPLIRLVGKLFPKSKITFCVRPEHAPLFQGIPIITQVITFDKRKKNSGLFGFFSFLKYLNSFNFDLVIDLHRSVRSTALCCLLKNARVVGFKSATLSLFFDDRVERVAALQEVRRNFMTIKPLCPDFALEKCEKLGGKLTCFIDDELLTKTLHYYAITTLSKKIVGIAPGSVWNTKRYPAEYFANVAETLYQSGYAIALFGAQDDWRALDEFKQNYKNAFYDFSAKTSLSQLPALLASLDVLIVNDSGAMHMAVAAGTPCVAIFGPTVKGLGFFPYDNQSVVIENNNLTCRPCGKHGGNSCPLGHFKCMKDINPDRVVAATLLILSAQRQRRQS